MRKPTQLRLWRLQRGMTCRELGQRVGVSHVFVSKVERGICPMPSERALDWANALGVNYDEVIRYNAGFRARKATERALGDAKEDLIAVILPREDVEFLAACARYKREDTPRFRMYEACRKVLEEESKENQ